MAKVDGETDPFDPYKILDVSRSATEDEIKTAYKKMARRWHPDRHVTGKEAAAKHFIDGHDAYRRLMDERRPRRRKEGHGKAPKEEQPAKEQPAKEQSAKASSAHSGPRKPKSNADGDAGPPPRQSDSPPDHATPAGAKTDKHASPSRSPSRTPSNRDHNPDPPAPPEASSRRPSKAPTKPEVDDESPSPKAEDTRPTPLSPAPASRPLSSHAGDKGSRAGRSSPPKGTRSMPSSPEPIPRPLSSHASNKGPQDMPGSPARGARSMPSSPAPVPRPLSSRASDKTPQSIPVSPARDAQSIPSSPGPVPRPLSSHASNRGPQDVPVGPERGAPSVPSSPEPVPRPLSSRTSDKASQDISRSPARGAQSVPSSPEPVPRPLSSHASDRGQQDIPVSPARDAQPIPSSPGQVPRQLSSHASDKSPKDIPTSPEQGVQSVRSSPEAVQESLPAHASEMSPQDVPLPASPETTPLDSPRSPADKLRARFRKKRKTVPEPEPGDDSYVYITKSKGMPTAPNGDDARDSAVVVEESLDAALCPILSLSSSKEWVFPLKLTLEELFRGTSIRFHITRRLLSNTTKQSLVTIHIPEGTLAGTKICCPGVGHERKDGRCQDVIFVVEEKPHDRFQRKKDDLFVDVLVPYDDRLAEDGGDISVTGIDGEKITVNIPYPVDRNSTEGNVVVKGAGMPFRKGRGELVLRWQVVFPSPTSKWDSVVKALQCAPMFAG